MLQGESGAVESPCPPCLCLSLPVSTNGEVWPWAGSVSHQLSGSRDRARDQDRQVRGRQGENDRVHHMSEYSDFV